MPGSSYGISALAEKGYRFPETKILSQEQLMKLSTFELLKNAPPENGFTLSDEQLKQLQSTLLTMLKDLHLLAEDNGIKLRLGGGNLLGAVREGKMIPWDDDLDLQIARSDYTPMLSLLHDQYRLYIP